VKVLANGFIALVLDFTHELKTRQQAPVYGSSSSATASSVTFATVRNTLDVTHSRANLFSTLRDSNQF